MACTATRIQHRTPAPFDDERFKRNLIETIPHLRAYAHGLCANAAAAEDLSQEALLKAWKARRSFKVGSNIKAWAFTILRNQFYTERRQSWRNAEWDEEVAEKSLKTDGGQMAALELDELRRALSKLPGAQRDVLILVGAGGFSYGEAAEICGCAIGTIKSRLNRARATLETALDRGWFADADDDDVPASRALDALIEEMEETACV